MFIRICKLFFSFLFSCCLIFFMCFCVSADTSYKTLDFTVAKSQAIHIYETIEGSSFFDLSPSVYDSPFGGEAFMFRFSDSQLTSIRSKANRVNSNTYFNQIKFKKGYHYTIDLFLVLRESNLFYNNKFDFELQQFHLVDSNRNIRLSTPSKYVTRELDISDGILYFTNPEIVVDDLLFANIGTGSYGFLPIHWEFIPNEDFNGWFFNYMFTFDSHDDTPLSFWGISDVIIKESTSEASDELISNGLNDINSTLTKQNDDFNSAFNEDKYLAPDKSKLDEESALTSDIYGSTASDRDVAESLWKDFPVVTPSETLEEVPSVPPDGSFMETIFVWRNILEYAMFKFPWLQSILNVSLALGIFAFLFGFLMYSVGKLGKNKGG